MSDGGVLTLAALRQAAAITPGQPGAVDEVIVAMPDLQGRLQGSGLSPGYFVDEILGGATGAEASSGTSPDADAGAGTDTGVDTGSGFGACAYLLAVDVDMQPGTDYAHLPWVEEFGDMRLVPDLATLRRAPWQPESAIVLADAFHTDGSPVAVAPRTVLRRQLDRLADAGLVALAGTELEFVVFEESYAEAARRSYAGLTPASRYNVDYALVGTERMDGLVRRLRRAMAAVGVPVETARAEVHPGQYEIVFRYDDALRACDNHVLYKTAAKRLAAAAGQSLTFMAKYDGGEGNSCHVHFSLRDPDGTPVFTAPASRDDPADRGDPSGGAATNVGRDDDGAGAGSMPSGDPVHVRGQRTSEVAPATGSRPGRAGTPRPDVAGMSPLMQSFVAGQLACMAEFCLLFAPNVNSYKRLAPGSFAPRSVAWGQDNRTCAVRVVGSGTSLRIEHRVPGGDANPYLAVAGIVAAGLHGIEHGLVLEPATVGNAFATPPASRLPRDLADAADAWRDSEAARAAFGEDVVTHLARAAEVELAAYAGTVTDWERHRGFERL